MRPMQLVGMEDAGAVHRKFACFSVISSISARGRHSRSGIPAAPEPCEMNLPQPNILGSELGRAEALLELRLTPQEYALYR